MINLLPPKEKGELLLVRQKKLVIILGSIFLIFSLCLVFVFLSIYFFALGEANAQRIILQQNLKGYQAAGSNEYSQIIKKYNLILPKVSFFYENQKHFSEALSRIYEIARPSGIFFSGLNIDGTKNRGGAVSVSISGMSSTRDDLLAYEKSLKNSLRARNVSFSPESWISSQNISFSVSFDLMFYENQAR